MASPAPEPSPPTRVCVRVPATTANMGPSFDCIGMAVDLWNEVEVERAEAFSLEIHGEGADALPRDASNYVVTGFEAAFRAAGRGPAPPCRFICRNDIPFSRGLGSSSAAIVSGLVAGLVLAGHELPVRGEEGLLQLAAQIEGHPDNVAPAIYGGIQLGLHTGERWYTTRVNLPPGLQCVLFIPDAGCETSSARAVLPDSVPRQDVVFNMSRTALLVHAFTTNNLHELRYATEDRLHQPYRSKILPALFPLINAAMDAGAHGAFLSGAGSTVLALTSGRSGDIYTQKGAERKETQVAEAMMKAAKECGVPGKVIVAQPVETGAHVVGIKKEWRC